MIFNVKWRSFTFSPSVCAPECYGKGKLEGLMHALSSSCESLSGQSLQMASNTTAGLQMVPLHLLLELGTEIVHVCMCAPFLLVSLLTMLSSLCCPSLYCQECHPDITLQKCSCSISIG